MDPDRRDDTIRRQYVGARGRRPAVGVEVLRSLSGALGRLVAIWLDYRGPRRRADVTKLGCYRRGRGVEGRQDITDATARTVIG